MKTVLIIDDDKISRKMITKMLQDEYEVSSIDNGPDGIKFVESTPPDVILLDVEMPDMNGYEVCQQLKTHHKTKNIPIIFLSGKSSIRERMSGYEAGGDDYIIKPCDDKELKAKINVTHTHYLKASELSKERDLAVDTATTAIAGTGELGIALRFVQETYASFNVETLVQNLFSTLNHFHLRGCMIVEYQSTPMFFSSNGMVKPLEQDLMMTLRPRDRFCDFGCRTQLNYSKVSLLIKNMPIDDRDRYGRIKDLIPHLVEAVQARVVALEAEQAVNEQLEELNHTVKSTQTAFDHIITTVSGKVDEAITSINSMYDALEYSIPTMGLEDDQEHLILDMFEQTILQIRLIENANGETKESLRNILNMLDEIVKKQAQIHFSNEEPPIDAPQSIEDDDGVELF